MKNINPCKTCSNPSHIPFTSTRFIGDGWWYSVHCADCGTEGVWCSTETRAINAWNDGKVLHRA